MYFLKSSEVIHRQVEHQIRFHSLPREPASDHSAVDGGSRVNRIPRRLLLHRLLTKEAGPAICFPAIYPNVSAGPSVMPAPG